MPGEQIPFLGDGRNAFCYGGLWLVRILFFDPWRYFYQRFDRIVLSILYNHMAPIKSILPCQEPQDLLEPILSHFLFLHSPGKYIRMVIPTQALPYTRLPSKKKSTANDHFNEMYTRNKKIMLYALITSPIVQISQVHEYRLTAAQEFNHRRLDLIIRAIPRKQHPMIV